MVNTVILMGRMTKNPEIRETKNGKKLLDFTLAVEGYNFEQTEFVDCQVWNKTAEYLAKNSIKGSVVYLQGRLTKQTYQNKDGNTVYKVFVLADSVKLPNGSKNAYNEQLDPFNTESKEEEVVDFVTSDKPLATESDLPF